MYQPINADFINGFSLKLLLINDNKIKIQIRSKNDGKKYQAQHDYQSQNQMFKFAFYQWTMKKLFQYIKENIIKKNDIIKISNQGQLQIGIKINNEQRFLLLKTQETENSQVGKIIQITNFIKKDVNILKQQLYKFNYELRQQLKGLKKQITQLKQNQILPFKKQISTNINDIKKIYDQKLQTNEKLNQVKIKDIQKTFIQNIKGQVKINDQKYVQINKQIEKIYNFLNLAQQNKILQSGKQIQNLKLMSANLQDNFLKELKRISQIENKFNPIYPNLIKQPQIFVGKENKWVDYSQNGVYLDVDYSLLNLKLVPKVLTSLQGSTSHWGLTGINSIYNLSTKGFRVYIRCTQGTKLRVQTTKNWNLILHYIVVISQ